MCAYRQIRGWRAAAVFGNGPGDRPAAVQNFVVLRGDAERRNAWLEMGAQSDATDHVIYSGVATDKLYTSVMVYRAAEYYMRLARSRPGVLLRIRGVQRGRDLAGARPVKVN